MMQSPQMAKMLGQLKVKRAAAEAQPKAPPTIAAPAKSASVKQPEQPGPAVRAGRPPTAPHSAPINRKPTVGGHPPPGHEKQSPGGLKAIASIHQALGADKSPNMPSPSGAAAMTQPSTMSPRDRALLLQAHGNFGANPAGAPPPPAGGPPQGPPAAPQAGGSAPPPGGPPGTPGGPGGPTPAIMALLAKLGHVGGAPIVPKGPGTGTDPAAMQGALGGSNMSEEQKAALRGR